MGQGPAPGRRRAPTRLPVVLGLSGPVNGSEHAVSLRAVAYRTVFMRFMSPTPNLTSFAGTHSTRSSFEWIPNALCSTTSGRLYWPVMSCISLHCGIVPSRVPETGQPRVSLVEITRRLATVGSQDRLAKFVRTGARETEVERRQTVSVTHNPLSLRDSGDGGSGPPKLGAIKCRPGSRIQTSRPSRAGSIHEPHLPSTLSGTGATAP